MIKKFFQRIVSNVLWRDKTFTVGLALALILCLAAWLLSAQAELGEQIISWHYTVYFGIDRVGPWWNVLYYPGFATCVLLLNFFLASWLYFSRRLYSYIVVYITVLVQLFTVLQLSALLYNIL